jgi:hypothetical protein
MNIALKTLSFVWRHLKNIIGAMIACLLYGVMISSTLSTFFTSQHLTQNGVETTATVLDVDPYKGGRGVKYEFTVVATDERDKYVTQVWERAPTKIARRMKPGDQILIRYDPQNPSVSMVEGYNGVFWLVLLSLPVWCIIYLLIVVLWNRRLELLKQTARTRL